MTEKNKIIAPLVDKSDEIDFRRLFGALIDNRWIIVSITAFFSVFGILYVIASTPVYQSDAMVQVSQNPANSLIENLNQILPQFSDESSTEIELIQSRMILGRTVEQLNLATIVSRAYTPIIGKLWATLTGNDDASVKIEKLAVPDNLLGVPLELRITDNNHYQLLQDDAILLNGTRGQLAQGHGVSLLISEWNAEPNMRFNIMRQTELSAINKIATNLTVVDKGQTTGVLTLTLTGTDPVQIRTILDAICQNYLMQNIDRKSEEAAKSLVFLNKELPRVRGNLDQAEDKLNAFRQRNDSVDLPLEAKSMLDTMVSIDTQLNELTFKEAEISKLYTPSHPTYRALLEQRNVLVNEKDQLNKKINTMPKTQQEIIRLTRDVDSGQAIYMQLLNKQQELSINKASTVGDVRIIDQAVTQPNPIAPRKRIIIIIATLLGAMIAMAYVIIKAILHRGIEEAEQLEEMGLNVYATVPLSEWQQKIDKKVAAKGDKAHTASTLLAIDNPTDLSVESLRNLRTSLHFAMLEAKNNILMITGANPGIGKSFIVSNLSAVVSQSGARTLLIDADMRRGFIHEAFGYSAESGLSDLLIKSSSLEQCIKSTSIEGLDLLTRGRVPPNPSELLMNKNLTELLSWAQQHYDMVLIDTPPVLAVTDAMIIGKQAGTSLLVTRFEQNTQKEVELSIKRLNQNGIEVKGAILNAIVRKARTEMSYGYYHYEYHSDK